MFSWFVKRLRPTSPRRHPGPGARHRPRQTLLTLELLEERNVPSATTWYVNDAATGTNTGQSWTNAFTDLQTALADAHSGDQIWVAQGTYKPTSGTDRTISFVLDAGVAVYGGFAGTETALSQRNWVQNVTTLSGDIGTAGNSSDNSYHVVTSNGLDKTAVLDGFTITGGNANVLDSYPENVGGGMYNNSSSPTLANDTFSGSFALYGGGMYNDNSSAPTLTNVIFSGNSADFGGGGGMYNDNSSSPTLTDVTFSGNFITPNGLVTGVGAGGGMLNLTLSSPTLTNVTFSSNSAFTGGGIANIDSSPTLTNVTFSSNSATSAAAAGAGGGGMVNNLSSLTLINVTFSGNSTNAGAGGGGVRNYSTSLTLINSILWGDTGGEIVSDSTSTVTVGYSDVQGGWAGTGNINQDPLFVDAAHSNLHLQPGSPAIDVGTNTYPATGTNLVPLFDRDNNPRPVDGGTGNGAVTDMGAYEFQAAIPILSLATNQVNPTNGTPIDFQVVFSVPVTGFTSSGVSLSGTAGATAVQVTGSGTTYDLAVSGMTQDGTVVVALKANAAQDSFGYGSVASTDLSVVFDTTPPQTTASAGANAAGWDNSTATITLSATDPTLSDGSPGSGVAHTYYEIDSNASNGYQLYNAASKPTVSTAGIHTVSFYSVDVAGNAETPKSLTVKIDETPPSTTASAGANAAGWNSSTAMITLSASDPGSGVAHTYYEIDSNNSNGYRLYNAASKPTVSTAGIHTVSFYSVDVAGNMETPKSLTVKIDETPPSTTASAGANTYGWNNGTATVTLSASDPNLADGNTGSGVAHTYYEIDSNNSNGYLLYNAANKPTVSGEGIHTVYFYSVDVAGNAETPKSLTVKIDETPPKTSASLSGTPGTNNWYVSPVQVTLSASDPPLADSNAGSGVAHTYYTLDNGSTPTPYTGPFTVSGQGSHTVAFYSVDVAGNIEGSHTTSFKIDTIPPTASINTKPPASTNSTSATFSLSGSDPGSHGVASGVVELVYQLDHRPPVIVLGSSVRLHFSVGVGQHTLKVYAVDAAGNQSAVLKDSWTVVSLPKQRDDG